MEYITNQPTQKYTAQEFAGRLGTDLRKESVVERLQSLLTLSGERSVVQRAGRTEQMVRQRSERSHGRFHRRFILPETVDTERVSAKGRDGVLELTIAKQAKAQPRRITVGS